MPKDLPIDLYIIHEDSGIWRKVYRIIHDIYGNSIFLREDIKLNRRDLLIRYNLPPESWIDLETIEIWIRSFTPIPFMSILYHLFQYQESNGGIYINNKYPHSGSTYRMVEFATLIGVKSHRKIKKAIEFLINSLRYGGLPSPGPIDGAILEIGTTARFLHILDFYISHTQDIPLEEKIIYTKAIHDMVNFLKENVFRTDEKCAWHTNKHASELQHIDECIVGATSLALYAIVKVNLNKEILDKEIKELINKVCNWLVSVQDRKGGWSETVGGEPNIDNTFNAVRALKASIPFLEGELRVKVLQSLERAKKYIYALNPSEFQIVSLKAMLVRSLLVINDEFYKDPFFIKALASLLEDRDKWYDKKAHIYNELLISSLALAETLYNLKKKGVLKRFIEDIKITNKTIYEFLFDFPVEIPPFYPGYKKSLGDRFLNALTKASVPIKVIDILSESITLRDIYSMMLSIFIFFTLIANEDFLKAIVLPNVPKGSSIDMFITGFIMLIYFAWLSLKFKFRVNTRNFLSTTLLSLLASHILFTYWLKYSFEIVSSVDPIATPYPYIRLLLSVSLILDLGKKLFDISQINKLFLTK